MPFVLAFPPAQRIKGHSHSMLAFSLAAYIEEIPPDTLNLFKNTVSCDINGIVSDKKLPCAANVFDPFLIASNFVFVY